MRIVESAVLVVVVGFLTSGCCEKVVQKAATKATEVAVEKASGGDTRIRVGNNVDISDLNKAFQYPGSTPKGRLAKTTESGKGTTYIMESNDSMEKIKMHYAGMKGYKESLKLDTTDGAIYGFEDASNNESFHVTITQSGKATMITVMHVKKSS